MRRSICTTRQSCSSRESSGPPGMTYEKLIQEMDEKLQFPGLSNTWTMPVENRLDMELTGIKTPLGMKVQGPNVDGIQQAGFADSELSSLACRKCDRSLLRRLRKASTSTSSQPGGGCSLRPHDCGRSDGGLIRDRRARISPRTSKGGSVIRSTSATRGIFATMSTRCVAC